MKSFQPIASTRIGFNMRTIGAPCMSCLAVACIGDLALAAQGASPTQTSHSYYYFKEERPLSLDVTRVAVFRTPAKDGNFAAVPDLSPYGLDGSTVTPMAVRGWFFGKTAATITADAEIEGTVRKIAAGQGVDFVSPVFLDDEGGPIVITPFILVGFDRNLDPARAEAILAESGAGEILDRDWANMKRTYRLKSASSDGFEVLLTANELAQRPEVTFAEPDMMFMGHQTLIPNDTYFPQLWGLHNDGTFAANVSCTLVDFDMDAPEAWDITTGDPSIIVAVLDTGVQQDHPDLNLYTPGFDATGEGGDGGPVNGCDNHGTSVVGCVSGIINNNLGIVGIAPGVKSASARIGIAHPECDNIFTTQASWVVASLAWAESIGARITNNSWGGDSSSVAAHASIVQKYADTRAAGMVHFAAAGNAASDTISYPAALPSVNAVAALDPCGNRAVFSNYGEGLAFSAPGHYGISTDRTGSAGYNDGIGDGACVPDGGLGCSSDADCSSEQICFLVSEDDALVVGTSFASPYAAGVAALALSVNPDMTAWQLEELMRQSSVDLGDPGYDTEYGWGFVNAANAVALAANPPLPTLAAEPGGAGKVRFLSFVAPTDGVGLQTALEVNLSDLDGFGTELGVRYVNTLRDAGNNPVFDCPDSPFSATGSSFKCGILSCSPEYRDWASDLGGEVLHVTGAGIVANSVFEVAQLAASCMGNESACVAVSEPLPIGTTRWGDVNGDEALNVSDVSNEVDVLKAVAGHLPKYEALVQPNVPDPIATVTVVNVSNVVDALKGFDYPFPGPAGCP